MNGGQGKKSYRDAHSIVAALPKDLFDAANNTKKKEKWLFQSSVSVALLWGPIIQVTSLFITHWLRD